MTYLDDLVRDYLFWSGLAVVLVAALLGIVLALWGSEEDTPLTDSWRQDVYSEKQRDQVTRLRNGR
jgi:hypothetical protein